MNVHWSTQIEPSTLTKDTVIANIENGKTFSLIQRIQMLDAILGSGVSEGWLVNTGDEQNPKLAFIPDGTFRALTAAGVYVGQ